MCNGASTGSVVITPSGGVGPYTITPAQTGLAAGSYTFTVKDANNCTFTVPVTITEPQAITVTTAVTNVLCNGASTGSVVITPSGGVGPYTITPAQTGLDAGSYTFTIKDANNCTITVPVTITQPAAISASTVVANVLCNGASTGSVVITPSGGVGPYTIMPAQTGLAAGSYTFTVKDANNCTITVPVTITEPEAITATTSITNVLCNGASTGSVVITPTGGVGPYTITPATTSLAAGSYTFTVKDANNCSLEVPVTITENATITASASITDVDCNGATTGSVIITPEGGVAPYTITPATTGLAAGSYTFTVRDANNCLAVVPVTINEPSPLVASSAVTNVVCNGGSTGSVNIIATGGKAPYIITPGQTNLVAGTYIFTVKDANNCEIQVPVTISEPAAISATTVVNNITCFGSADGTVKITPDGGTPPYLISPAQTGLSAGEHVFIIRDANGCEERVTVTIDQPAQLESETDTVICADQVPFKWNGSEFTIAGRYQVMLTNTRGCDSLATLNLRINPLLASTTSVSVCSNQLPYQWNNASYNASGSYQFTTRGSNGCDSVATLRLTVNPVDRVSMNVTVCSNELPYQWKNRNLSAAGVYADTVKGVLGCDSINTLVLTVNPVRTSVTTADIRFSQLPYSWNGQSILSAGTYKDTLLAANGCDSVAVLELSVKSIVKSSVLKSICTNQLPFTWNGRSYNAGGTYTDSLISASGSDSVVTLLLTVNAVVRNTVREIICSNELPYTWNGDRYNTAGNYEKTLVSALGCDSVVTLILTIRPVETSTTDTTICSNNLPFVWNGSSYNAAGSYQKTLVSHLGCDSIATLNLVVNPVVTSTTDTTICSNTLPFVWNGSSYNAAGRYQKTLTSALGCDSIATLNLVVNPVVTSTTDTTICSNNLPFVWNGSSYNASGRYDKTLISALGCDSIATLNLVVNPVVTSTTDTTICSNTLPFVWNGSSYNAAGRYQKTLTSALGCDSIATLNLVINPVVTSTTDTTICLNNLPFVWNGTSYNASGRYDKTLISALGCDSIATLNLVINPVITSTTDTTICSNNLPFVWNGSSYNAAGRYQKTLTSALGCDSIATLNLVVNPVVTSTTDTTICSNNLPFVWNGSSYNAAGSYQKTLTSALGCDSIATLNLVVNPVVTSTTDTTICSNNLPFVWNGSSYNASGRYDKTLISALGCDSIATLNLVVNPVVTSTTDTTICSNNLPFVWNGSSYNASGRYDKTLISALGCDSIATLNLVVNPVVTSTTDTTICSNNLPLVWNATSYNAAGRYQKTLISALGCDSIATLNLVVNPVVTSTTDTTICSNNLPLVWNGTSYGAAGRYQKTLISALGCDSIATLNLVVNPVITSTTDTTICSNKLPFVWNGSSYNASGRYDKTLISALGCDSIATLNLVVNPVVTSTTDTTICSNNLPFVWNGSSYNSAGSYQKTLTSSLGCDSIATLNLVVNPVVTSTTDTTICSNNLPVVWNGKSYAAAGTYQSSLTSSAGCDSIATLNLVVIPVVTSMTDTTICSNQLPFVWNGTSYDAAGTYQKTLVSAPWLRFDRNAEPGS